MVDREFLQLYAARTGLGLKYLSKDEKISLALEQLRTLFPGAVFKGGTALNRVHLAKLGVSRFSEDIDLDCPGKGRMADRKAQITERMQNLRGFEIAAPRTMNWTVRYDCGYALESGERDQIRVEFYLKSPVLMPSEDVLVKSSFIEAHPTVFRIYTLEVLMAKKFVALYNRMEGKDIYDMFYLLDMPFDRHEFAMALRAVQEENGIAAEGFYENLRAKLRDAKKNSFYLGNCTNHFIPGRLRPNWKIFIDTLALKIDRLLIYERQLEEEEAELVHRGVEAAMAEIRSGKARTYTLEEVLEQEAKKRGLSQEEVRQVNKGIAADMEEIKGGKTKTISHEKLKKKLRSGANR
jgi:predicted nucleotidyltransferase component of viral defense system